MQVKRWVSVASLLLSAAISIVWTGPAALKPYGMTDFRAVYYGTRCLLQHHNPYNVSELERVVRDEDGERPSETVQQHQAVVLYVNLPTTFLFVAPFAVLPFGIAQGTLAGTPRRIARPCRFTDMELERELFANGLGPPDLYCACQQRSYLSRRQHCRNSGEPLPCSCLVFPSGAVCAGRRYLHGPQPRNQAP